MEIYVAVAGFIAFDIGTGLLKAFKTGSFNSTAMREGGFHKLSELIALFGAGLFEKAEMLIQFGIDVPALKAVAVYIIIMELVSIIENLCEVNPDLCRLFKPYLEKLRRDD